MSNREQFVHHVETPEPSAIAQRIAHKSIDQVSLGNMGLTSGCFTLCCNRRFAFLLMFVKMLKNNFLI